MVSVAVRSKAVFFGYLFVVYVSELCLVTLLKYVMKTCVRGFANNKGADQPAHPRSLISTFFILWLESII